MNRLTDTKRKITAIGFDFGGVIEGQPGSVFNRDASELLGISVRKFKTAYFFHNKLINNNLISRESFWKKVLAEVGQTEKFSALMKYIQTRPKVINAKVLAIVDALHAHGYKVGILSNNSLETRGIFVKKGIVEHFDVIVISAEIGYSKPDPRAFEIFFEKLGCKAEQCVFVDDTEESFVSAKEIGFYPIIFTTPAALKSDLRNLGVVL